jgi:hypothetical protein
MKPEDALNILAQAAQMANMPAQAHQQCLEAFKVLQDMIKPAVAQPE